MNLDSFVEAYTVTALVMFPILVFIIILLVRDLGKYSMLSEKIDGLLKGLSEDLNDKGVSITKLHSKEKSKKDFTKKCLLDSGLWTSFLTRPYSKIPDSETVPSSIFVTAMNTDPLCPDAELIIKNEIKAFEEGINRISLCLLYTSPSPRD